MNGLVLGSSVLVEHVSGGALLSLNSLRVLYILCAEPVDTVERKIGSQAARASLLFVYKPLFFNIEHTQY